jgi:hypothetical protein
MLVIDSPSPHWQSLESQCFSFDISPEQHRTYNNEENICDVKAITLYVTDATSFEASLLLYFYCTAESCSDRRDSSSKF